MNQQANVASCVIFVRELGRSVAFYSEVFGCKTAIREEDGALLLAPGGFQIYPIAKGDRAPHPVGGLGDQHLMWATDDAEGLAQFEAVLTKRGLLHLHAYRRGGDVRRAGTRTASVSSSLTPALRNDLVRSWTAGSTTERSVAGELLRAYVVVVDPAVVEQRAHRLDHAARTAQVVDRPGKVGEVPGDHVLVDEPGLPRPVLM